MTTTTKGRDSRNLLADDSGATMVMGVFMAMAVVGMIYYVWGLGGAIIHRERMQDAADAAAFGASVFAARGMNIIALLNVLMACFAVVGTAARLLSDFIEATAAAADLVCVLTLGVDVEACALAVVYDGEWAATSSMLSTVASTCDTVVRGMHYAQVGIRTGAMIGGEAYVLTMLPARYRPTVTEGVFVPGSLSISIQSEDDDTTWACHHGTATMFWVRGPALALVALGELAMYEPISEYWLAGEAWVAAQEFGDLGDGSSHYCDNGALTFQRVVDDHWLGDGNFQNYSAVYGTPPFGWVQSGVAVANWGRTNGTAPNVFGLDVSVVQQLHRLSFADSEYYYEEADGTDYIDGLSVGVRQEWLWHTRWRARMRRFHAGAGISGMLGSVIGGVESVIVH